MRITRSNLFKIEQYTSLEVSALFKNETEEAIAKHWLAIKQYITAGFQLPETPDERTLLESIDNGINHIGKIHFLKLSVSENTALKKLAVFSLLASLSGYKKQQCPLWLKQVITTNLNDLLSSLERQNHTLIFAFYFERCLSHLKESTIADHAP